MQALGFVWSVFVAVALPTTLFALAGRAADARFGASPWFTLLGLLLSLAISCGLVYVLAKRYLRNYKRLP